MKILEDDRMSSKVSTVIKAALGAAAASLLASGHAMAANVNPYNTASAGGGDVVVSLTDETTDASYSLDLGSRTLAFVGGTVGSKSWSASSSTDAALSSFLSAAGTDKIDFSVVGGSWDPTSSTTTLETNKFISTTDNIAPSSFGQQPTNSALINWASMNTQFITGLNSLPASSTNSYTAVAGASGNFGQKNSATVWFGQTASLFGTNALLGTGITTQALYEFASTATSATFAQKQSPISEALLGTFGASLANNVFSLTYTPVSSIPIPAAVWLFGSGLLGLAGVGRRRATQAGTA
jgi:hypothetical protein